jgi:hypothetical protein
MTKSNSSRATRDELRISSVEPAGWEPSSGRVPKIGDFVYCTDGPARVVKLLGRTSDGSRLLELRCGEGTPPFFASSANVLLRSKQAGGEGDFLDEYAGGIR